MIEQSIIIKLYISCAIKGLHSWNVGLVLRPYWATISHVQSFFGKFRTSTGSVDTQAVGQSPFVPNPLLQLLEFSYAQQKYCLYPQYRHILFLPPRNWEKDKSAALSIEGRTDSLSLRNALHCVF